MSVIDKLEHISNTSPWIIDLAVEKMTNKLNHYMRIGIFDRYMLNTAYLRQLLYDCANEIIAERVEYGITC